MLKRLPPHARVWVYQANRFFTKEEEEKICRAMQEFIPAWASHGNDIYGDFCTAESLFLIVGADEERSPTSGCSIDSLNRHIQKIGNEFNIDFFDRLRIAYADAEGAIRLLPMADFKDLLKKGELSGATMVFNNLIVTHEELVNKWRTEVKNSWHKNLCDVL